MAFPKPGEGFTGTWITANDAVYSSTKRACIETFSIRPNRCWIQYTRFHARNQVCNDVGFDFHVGHDTGMDASSFKSSLDPKNSRAERDDSRRFEGIIHMIYFLIL